ncbi:hypothetical protein GOARA_063_01360 [Gordonia araii NBRC 100433]|uniref:Uncharacterized protein n=2 Tax=Gordonia araii TaxID=263909 RepID=G7H512_9ACTN|nr:hypothetical protein GOARA_063_01360 [Gordonia araii NBRC 100433]
MPGPPQQPYPQQQFVRPAYPPPYPPQSFAPAPKPPLKNVGLTRVLGAIPIIGWFAIIVGGFTTFTTVVANSTGASSTINGFGRWTHQGEGLPLRFGASAMTLGGVYPTLLVLLPVLILAILIVCNVGRRPIAIINTVVAILAALLALTFILRPDFTTITFNERSGRYIDANYTFSAGPSAYFTLVVCLVIVAASVAVAIVGGRAKVPPP